MNIPNHVAIILDGNGRWAERHNVPRAMGHKKGCEAVENIVSVAARKGISYLTVYGFSTENWKRSEEEVGALMKLFRVYLKKLYEIATANNVCCRFIGSRDRFDPDIVEGMNKLENDTEKNTGLTFVIAVNYGSRDEICRAVRKIADDLETGKISKNDISEELIASYLDTKEMPDPDLLIRTGSELRLSNYLLYQSAYTELYVTDTLWPDFTEDSLDRAIEDFNSRHRKFGGRKDEKK